MMGINHSKCAYWATIDGRESDLKFHISNGAELSRVDATTGRSLIHIACERGDVRCVELINQCTRGRHLNQMDRDENTPLNLAVYWNHFNTVCTLLKLGADPNFVQKRSLRFHRMPQHIAATKRCMLILQELIHHGCHIDVQDSWGCTPLMVAINSKSIECVKLLLVHQANVELRDYLYNATPLQIAIHSKYYDVIPLLLYNGAEINVSGAKFSTPLVQAAEIRAVHLIQTLLEFGGKPNVLVPFANKLHLADLIEEYSQPRKLSSLCRIVLRRKYKSQLPQIVKNIFSPKICEYILGINMEFSGESLEEMEDSNQ
ncbi:Cortactin-binding protein 2-like [Oopsacas minuta]|uniref:Cortactin-binding protein 2-like n=1 Tax=Oopsacas minuta TaxID=111878 RepID=A0AAV7JEV4_9METZ|nr:Cortactin-binding protein 2-like [Oopsacas minuta]